MSGMASPYRSGPSLPAPPVSPHVETMELDLSTFEVAVLCDVPERDPTLHHLTFSPGKHPFPEDGTPLEVGSPSDLMRANPVTAQQAYNKWLQLSASSGFACFGAQNDIVVPWHRVIRVAVTKREPKTLLARYVRTWK